jgi:hypothetical protein
MGKALSRSLAMRAPKHFATGYHRLLKAPFGYFWLQQATPGYSRLQQATTGYHRLPQATTGYHRRPCLATCRVRLQDRDQHRRHLPALLHVLWDRLWRFFTPLQMVSFPAKNGASTSLQMVSFPAKNGASTPLQMVSFPAKNGASTPLKMVSLFVEPHYSTCLPTTRGRCQGQT